MKHFFEKQFWVLMIALLLGSGQLFAQSSQLSPEQKRAKSMEKLAQKMGMTDAQQAEAIAINEEYHQKIAIAQNVRYDSKEAKQAAIRPLRQAKRQAIIRLLTPEQKEAWTKKRQQEKHKRNSNN